MSTLGKMVEFTMDFDPNSVRVIDHQMRDALELDFINIKHNNGALTGTPARKNGNLLHLLEEYVKQFGWSLLQNWSEYTKTMDKMMTLREMKLCELVPERTEPYPPEVMNQPMPATLAHIYKQIVRAQLVAYQLRDLFDGFCGLTLLYKEEQAQFSILKRYNLVQPQGTHTIQRQRLNADVATKPLTEASTSIAAYASDFTKRLCQWKLQPKANFAEGKRITPPSTVYGMPHILRLLNKCQKIMTVIYTPVEMQAMVSEHWCGLTEYVLARDNHIEIGLPFPIDDTSQESELEPQPDYSIVDDDVIEVEEEDEELLDI